jgi:hypothetical protein
MIFPFIPVVEAVTEAAATAAAAFSAAAAPSVASMSAAGACAWLESTSCRIRPEVRAFSLRGWNTDTGSLQHSIDRTSQVISESKFRFKD